MVVCHGTQGAADTGLVEENRQASDEDAGDYRGGDVDLLQNDEAAENLSKS